MRESVIVLGGGVSGLSAAIELAESHSVILIEARERLGGRIFTIRNNGIPFELGAEFVHGRPPELMRLIRAAQLQTHEVPDRHWKESGRGLVELHDFWDQLSRITSDIQKHGSDTSFLTILERSCQSRESVALAKGFVEGFHGSPVEKASAKEILLSERSSRKIEGHKNLRIDGGYDLLVRFMENECHKRGVQICTATEVVAIDWRSRPAKIHVKSTKLSTMSADRVVVTVPIGVLRRGAIQLDPQPNQKLEAIRAIQPGSVIKLVLQFRSRFWEPSNFGFIHSNDIWFPTWWADQRGDILTAWAGGPEAEALNRQSNDFILHRAVETASKIFGAKVPRIKQILVTAHIHNWCEDVFTRGAYSFVPTGAVDAPRELARPESEAAFFAGEAVDVNHQLGTVHGAIASGRRAAHLIAACA
jgi:monoamine oxidase